MKRILLFVAAAAAMAACSDATAPAPTAAQRQAPSRAKNDEITCRSGYVVAYDQNGDPYCTSGGQAAAMSKPR